MLTLEQEELTTTSRTRDGTLHNISFTKVSLGSLSDERALPVTKRFNPNISQRARRLLNITPGRRRRSNCNGCGVVSRVAFRLSGTDEDSSAKTAECSKRRNHKVGLGVVHGLYFFFRGNETVDFVSDFFDGFIGRLWCFQLTDADIETKLGIGVY